MTCITVVFSKSQYWIRFRNFLSWYVNTKFIVFSPKHIDIHITVKMRCNPNSIDRNNIKRDSGCRALCLYNTNIGCKDLSLSKVSICFVMLYQNKVRFWTTSAWQSAGDCEASSARPLAIQSYTEPTDRLLGKKYPIYTTLHQYYKYWCFSTNSDAWQKGHVEG